MGERQTAIARLTFSAKVLVLQAQRWQRDLRRPVPRWPQTRSILTGARAEIRSRLFVDQRPEERAYEQGKVTNLHSALCYLEGVEIPAGMVFSFWRQVGRATARRGFVTGRMLQSGCVVPAIGGGLCQLSNALYELALRTGCEIVERHAHSHRLPGTPSRDATVAWNYIDLRFRVPVRTRIDLALTDSELIAAFVCEGLRPEPSTSGLEVGEAEGGPQQELQTCATCAEWGCSRHEPARDRIVN